MLSKIYRVSFPWNWKASSNAVQCRDCNVRMSNTMDGPVEQRSITSNCDFLVGEAAIHEKEPKSEKEIKECNILCEAGAKLFLNANFKLSCLHVCIRTVVESISQK